MAKQYNSFNILKLLVEGFTDRELRHLIRNLEGFQSLYSQFAERASTAELAYQIIEYAQQKDRLDFLLNWTQENYPSRYTRYQPYYDDAGGNEAHAGSHFASTELSLEPPFGTMRPDSPYYIERDADRMVWESINRGSGTTLFLQAPRQTGKSSLMRRIIERERRELNTQAVFIDLQQFPKRVFEDEEEFLINISMAISEALNIPEAINRYWQGDRTNIAKCSGYISEYILPQVENSLILAIDEVDRLHNTLFRGNFFGMLRVWHNRRAYDSNWQKLNLFLSSSTEAFLLVDDEFQSPFNIAENILLQDFTLEDVDELNKRHNSPLNQEQLNDLMDLTGGHPFLTRLALYQLVTQKIDFDSLLTQAAQDTGPFGEHLKRYRSLISDNPELEQTLSDILLRQYYEKNQNYYRLKSTGLIKEVGKQVILRNNLYTRYFWYRLNLVAGIRLAVGGPVQTKAGTYITRPADETLFNACKEGQFCYVLASRQIGKSSLMFSTAQRLEQQGIKTAQIDLNAIGRGITEEQWFFSLLDGITRRLQLDCDIQAWWEANSFSSPQRFRHFFLDIVLPATIEPIVIFIDEIDVMLGLEFSDEFFATIRAIYNDRAQIPDFLRLTFVFLGVAAPDDFIKDKTRTPFNIGRAIALNDFTKEECMPFRLAIETLYPRRGSHYFGQIYDWINGHPYLTQKLCQIFLNVPNPKSIDELVVQQFLAREASDDNLTFVGNRIKNDRFALEILKTYKQILLEEAIPDDGQSLPINRLKLYGLVVAENGFLKVRNKLYASALNLDWVDEVLKVFELEPYLTFFEKAGLSASVISTEDQGNISNILVRGQDPRYRTYGDIYVRSVEDVEGKIEHFQDFRDFILKQVEQDNDVNPLDGRLAFFISDRKPTLGMLLMLYSYKAENNFTIVPLDKKYVDIAVTKEDTRPDLDDTVDQHIGQINQYEGSQPINDPIWFFGHELTIDRVVQHLHKGQHVGIFGLRKMGKTSLIWQLQYKMNNELTCHIDLLAMSGNCHDLYREIIKRLAQNLYRHTYSLPSLRLVEQDYPDQEQQIQAFRTDVDALCQAMEKQKPDFRIVIFLDEVDFMLPVPAPAKSNWWQRLFGYNSIKQDKSLHDGFKGFERFLAVLRGLAQEKKGHLVVVVTSVNADINRIPRWESGTRRDNPMWKAFVEYFLPPLKSDETNLMVESIGSIMGLQYDDKSLEEIYRLSGGHPFVARQICSSIVDKCSTTQITFEQVQEGFEYFLQNKTRINYFETLWSDVFNTVYPGNADTVRRLLINIAEQQTLPPLNLSAKSSGFSGNQTDNIIKSLKEIHLLKDGEQIRIRMNAFAEWILSVKA